VDERKPRVDKEEKELKDGIKNSLNEAELKENERRRG
jgi:hypothetical protein